MKGVLKLAAINIMIACIYIGTGKLSDTVSIVRSQASPIWAPSAFMVAAVLISENRVWLGIFCGNVGINLWYFEEQQQMANVVVASILLAFFSLFESVSCGWLLLHSPVYKNGHFSLEPKERRGRGSLTVDTRSDAIWLFAVAPFTTFVAGTFNALSLSLLGLSDWNKFLQIWPTWVLGDLSSILCYMPFILHLWNYFHPVSGPSSYDCKACKNISDVNDGAVVLPVTVDEKHTNKEKACPNMAKTLRTVSHEMSIDMGTITHSGGDTRSPTISEKSRLFWITMKKLTSIWCRNNTSLCCDCRHNWHHKNQRREAMIGSPSVSESCLVDERDSPEFLQKLSHSSTLCVAPPVFSIKHCLLRTAECTVLFVVLIVLSLLIFFNFRVRESGFVQRLSYLVFPVVIWASFRFNRVGLPLAVVVVALIASAGTANHHGPLYHQDDEHSLLQVQMFVCVLAMVAITLAAIVHDRMQMEGELNDLNCTLESQVHERTKELKRANEELKASQAAAEEASRAKSEFLANMSHEIRTPIHAIINMASLVSDTELTSEQKEHLETVSQSADCLLHIANAILDLAKIEAGRLELEHYPFLLSYMIGSTMRMLQGRAKQKRLDVKWEVDPDVPEHLQGDSRRLQQCILNLVGNAIKFTQEGSVFLSVKLYRGEGPEDSGTRESLHLSQTPWKSTPLTNNAISKPIVRMGTGSYPLSLEENLQCVDIYENHAVEENSSKIASSDMGGCTSSRLSLSKDIDKVERSSLSECKTEENNKVVLLFSVHDTGIGIDKEKQKEVFKAFSQADSSTTRLYGGTGLGLSIVERFVGMMGGQIWLESELGRGSTFCFIAQFENNTSSSGHPKILPNVPQNAERGLGEVHLRDSIKSGKHRNRKIPETNAYPDSLENIHPKHFINDRENSNGQRNSITHCARSVVDIVQCPDAAGLIENLKVRKQKIAEKAVKLDLHKAGHVSLIGGMKVLLVEDNLVNQKVACQQLKKFGMEADVVSDGQQCLDALQKNREKYALVLMDIQMPVLDGLQATKLIRTDEVTHGFPRKPIIGLTAHAIQGYKDKCLEAGMDDYACKPLKADQLMEVIHRVVLMALTQPL